MASTAPSPTRMRYLPVVAQLAFAAAALSVPFFLSGGSYLLYVATQLGVYVVAAIGLNLLAGYVGQVSLGHAAFLAIGAYATALLTVDHQWSFWAAAVVGIVLSAGLGVLMALPSFRLTTWYFAFITLAFALVFEKMIVEWRGLTKGFAGVIGVPPPQFFGFELGQKALYWLVAGTAIVCFLIVRNMVKSRFGRGFVAVRDTPAAALAAGASPQRLKMLGFIVAAAFAGIAGAFFAVQKTVVTPDDFTADFSIFFLLTVVLGGLGTLWGPVFGALVFFLIPELLHGLESWRMLVYGCILLVLMLFAPQGLVGALNAGVRRLTARPRGAPGAAAATSAAAPVAHPPIAGAALAVEGLKKRFGGVAALDDVAVRAGPGTCCAIVGPNGSGKTTLLNVVGGFYERDEGTVQIDGRETRGMSAQAVAGLGLGRTFQTPRLLNDLSIVDNVLLGAFTRERAWLPEIVLRLPRARREAAALRAEALGYLDFVGIADRAEDLASEVPHGQQRLVEIARALMGGARLLMLDEPAAGLSMVELDKLEQLISRIRDLGATVVIVEHHLDLVASIASHVIVLDRGRVLAAGAPSEVFADPAVQRAYMGERAVQGAPAS
ncbi:branched-chain amino acid ABC transporter ATP-binding protein/permease [Chelatococcus reniformis]|uniref:Branched-chain amino acid ABC transporter permease n=1 Tax=Chelatococcus reniformis TaxID=1494448 RepID=A0A916URF8_9HYPH|nr:branched-chain amino acid ABC transporter ATP-binding protein/permease [Chelatococcus reniformis]GGC83205.1 branched-chain amino acid ABC transporter permease [Chelatococcus reniformis]